MAAHSNQTVLPPPDPGSKPQNPRAAGKYDSRGFAHKSYAAYYADGAPSPDLVKAADNKVPSMMENLYDGMGRVTDAITRTYGDEKWRTKTEYGGDRTTVIPPKGGTAFTTVTDVQGRTVERIEYTNAARTASQKTLYKYGKWDEPSQVIDPAGNTWTYTFDARGQQVQADDPDKGTATTTYDKLGRAVTTTDARDITLTTEYDKLGRKTALKKGSTLLASWTYDTVAKGRPTGSIRYIDGNEYTSTVNAYNDAYQPTSTTVTIPAGAGDLAGTYTWSAWRKSLAWGAFGGASAFKFARWGGAKAKDALWGSPTARTPVRVRPATRTSGAIWNDGPINTPAGFRRLTWSFRRVAGV
ncbi:hypothetical protein [Streptomyces sp. TRM72054]|uniref:hypothetical protein n=1 Tax=Streptomyces sp. TRM72054 TaxID=2870562 RepID=UPI0027DF8F6C|nr:hypothetical protein [Streptomyces sp. TRM72054]